MPVPVHVYLVHNIFDEPHCEEVQGVRSDILTGYAIGPHIPEMIQLGHMEYRLLFPSLEDFRLCV